MRVVDERSLREYLRAQSVKNGMQILPFVHLQYLLQISVKMISVSMSQFLACGHSPSQLRAVSATTRGFGRGVSKVFFKWRVMSVDAHMARRRISTKDTAFGPSQRDLEEKLL